MSVDLQLHRQTHIADFAVEKIVCTTNAADATAMAMVLLLVRIIEQVANETRVLQIKNMLIDDKTIKNQRR